MCCLIMVKLSQEPHGCTMVPCSLRHHCFMKMYRCLRSVLIQYCSCLIIYTRPGDYATFRDRRCRVSQFNCGYLCLLLHCHFLLHRYSAKLNKIPPTVQRAAFLSQCQQLHYYCFGVCLCREQLFIHVDGATRQTEVGLHCVQCQEIIQQ